MTVYSHITGMTRIRMNLLHLLVCQLPVHWIMPRPELTPGPASGLMAASSQLLISIVGQFVLEWYMYMVGSLV